MTTIQAPKRNVTHIQLFVEIPSITAPTLFNLPAIYLAELVYMARKGCRVLNYNDVRF